MLYMRPDRVYATGVLAPMVGYNPPVDAQNVAQQFTQGPPLATMLGGLGMSNPFQKLWLRIKSAFAARGAGAFMNTGVSGLRGFGDANDPGTPGPGPQMAQQVAPQIAAQMQMLMHLPDRNSGSTGGNAAYEIARRRWNAYYRAG